MSNVLSEEKKNQVIALGRLGWSLRRIQRATGVRRETAAAYLRAAGVDPRPPGRWGRQPPAKPAMEVTPDPGSGSKPAMEVTPDSGGPPAPVAAPEPAPAPGRSPTASACEPYREVIEVGLGKGRNAKAIWRDLVDDHGFRGSYQSVKRFVSKLHGSRPPEARVVIETAPGEEAQVDYGAGPMVRDPANGHYRRARMFVLTLGYSRKSVRLLTFRSSARTWVDLHERAFRRLGGATRLVVLDNLGEGVLTPDIYDPALNPLYRLIACLVSDELTRRSDRLLERRRKQAGFRDPHKTLDNFDFSFNPKINRSLVFDLATGAFIGRREDALFLGPGGTGKSHLAQALGQAAIQQGYRVLYRETPILLEELAEAVLDGTRKHYLETITTVPLLIIDDFGMRKLPQTAAEDLLEVIMRRYERASCWAMPPRWAPCWTVCSTTATCSSAARAVGAPRPPSPHEDVPPQPCWKE